MVAEVISLQRSDTHSFSKATVPVIELVAGLGVVGDAHQGARVKHRSRVRADPTQPNLRQVHLFQSEVFADVAADGFVVGPGDLGENITTTGLDLLALPTGATLRIGEQALVTLTGLRNPCGQINGHADGLLDALRPRRADGSVELRGGVMGVVILGGTVRTGDPIEVSLPPGVPVPLARV